MILGPGEGRISNDVSHDLGQLVDFVHDLVDVDAAAVSQLKETVDELLKMETYLYNRLQT